MCSLRADAGYFAGELARAAAAGMVFATSPAWMRAALCRRWESALTVCASVRSESCRSRVSTLVVIRVASRAL